MPETTSSWDNVTEAWGRAAETWSEVGEKLGQLAILLPLAIIGVIAIAKVFRYFLTLKYEAEEAQRERELEEQKPMLDYLARKIAEETVTLEKETNEYDIKDVELDQETQDLLNKIGE